MKKAIFLGFSLLASAFSASGQVAERHRHPQKGLWYLDYPVDAETARNAQRLAQMWKGEMLAPPPVNIAGKTGGAFYFDPRSTGAAIYLDPRLTGGVDPRSTGGAMYLDPRLTGGAAYPGSGGALYGAPQKQPPSGSRRRNPPSGGFPAPSERRLPK